MTASLQHRPEAAKRAQPAMTRPLLVLLTASLAGLSMAGCQSTMTGSAGRLGFLTAEPTEPADRRAALFTSRRADPPAADAKSEPETELATLPGKWGEDDVLKMVVETELAGTSAEERAEWMTRLAQADEAEIPALLAERRRTRTSAGAPAEVLRDESDNASGPSAQQIILTARTGTTDSAPSASQDSIAANSTGTVTDDHATSGHDAASSTPFGVPRGAHPLSGKEDLLAAPVPGGIFNKENSSELSADRESLAEFPVSDPPTVTAVLDRFGVGGETAAARQAGDHSTRIQRAGAGGSIPPITEADAIARDLESAKSQQFISWQEDLDKLIALLETQIGQQSPGESELSRSLYLRQHVALKMLYLIASRRPEALQAIPAVSQDEQEFWTQIFWALSSTFDDEAMPDSTLRAAETVAQLREAIRQIEHRAALRLHQTVFCQRIDGFGDYVTFEEDHFAAGQPVLVYTEVRNFQSQSTAQGDYRTLLRSSMTIRQGTMNGPVVYQIDLPETEDRCQSRRRDYFHSYRIALPATLKPGPHVLLLEMTDSLTGKTGSTSLNFNVK